MPHLQELHERHKDQGLVLIGIHTTRGGERMPAYVEEAGIGYPVALDIDEKTTTAFRVNSYPDYYLIDRAGNLRVADLANDDLDRAVKVLLAEPVPEGIEAVPGAGADGEPEAEPGEGDDAEEGEPAVAVDAAVVLQDALAEAGRSKRRVLVHLGAPW